MNRKRNVPRLGFPAALSRSYTAPGFANSGSCAQVWFLQRRFHKDILLNPVLVLRFCPDLSSKPGHLSAATRELLFLLDGSSAVHKACGVQRVGTGLGVGSSLG